MSKWRIDIFVEDSAHEAFLYSLMGRLIREQNIEAIMNIRWARGGHGRALDELHNYQRWMQKGFSASPDLLVIGIDANCKSYGKMHKEIEDKIEEEFKGRIAVACPDPHIERWYLADPESFHRVVGASPILKRAKCERDYYKEILNRTIMNAGYPPSLGGVEFAREIVDAMDLYRAGKSQSSLKHFLDEVNSRLLPLSRKASERR
ncbi:MAG: DUF4276 family protein [Candidatus Sumerlaeota bacterium]|nr:DUF4276 family protein [Candidatus Sumerlaeota bacterium]